MPPDGVDDASVRLFVTGSSVSTSGGGAGAAGTSRLRLHSNTSSSSSALGSFILGGGLGGGGNSERAVLEHTTDQLHEELARAVRLKEWEIAVSRVVGDRGTRTTTKIGRWAGGYIRRE